MSDIYKNCLIVLRAAGERTEDAAHWLLSQDVGTENVHKVKAGPLSKTFRRSAEIAIDSGNKWAVFVDADVLIHSNSLKSLIAFGKKQKQNTFSTTAKVYDRFFCRIRRAGVRIYKTELLGKFLNENSGVFSDVRPDSNASIQMGEKGYLTINSDCVIGLHDFEQAYYDIFRKSYMHAHKHRHHIGTLIDLWNDLGEKDLDFQVAIWGVAAALLYPKSSLAGAREVPMEVFKEKISSFEEKKDLKCGPWLETFVQSVFDKDVKAEMLRNSNTGRIKRLLNRLRKTEPIRQSIL